MSDSKNRPHKDNASSLASSTDTGFLDLPDAPDFISEAPQLTFVENLRLCEQMLPFWNTARFQDQEPLGMTPTEFYL